MLECRPITLRVNAQRAVVHDPHPSQQSERLGSRPDFLAKRALRDVPGDYDSPSRRVAHGWIIVGLQDGGMTGFEGFGTKVREWFKGLEADNSSRVLRCHKRLLRRVDS